MAVGIEENSGEHQALIRPSPSQLNEWGVWVPVTQVAPRALCPLTAALAKFSLMTSRTQSSRTEATLRLLCVLMTARQCLQRTLPSHPQDKKRSS